MQKTIKLYDTDSELYEFSANVISCQKSDDGYNIVLDQTAFFPEGGGQTSDTGYIEDAKVNQTYIKDGIIHHICDKGIAENNRVHCKIDFEQRFQKMQNHSGEHIISGILHRNLGFDNVGFHLGNADTTLDINGILTANDIKDTEAEANRIIYENVKIEAYYPSQDELKNLEYRSKLDLKSDVRIVKIGEYDTCACCAPHTKYTGEIGLIKIISSEKLRGGTRLHIQCGIRAMEDYKKLQENTAEISHLLRSKPYDTATAVKELCYSAEKLKQKNTELTRKLFTLKAEKNEPSDIITVFEENYDFDSLRFYANLLKEKCHICCVFSEVTQGCFKYIISSDTSNVRIFSKSLNTIFSGKGGGSEKMVQGTLNAEKDAIISAIPDILSL